VKWHQATAGRLSILENEEIGLQTTGLNVRDTL
jgi:hypothetical protein